MKSAASTVDYEIKDFQNDVIQRSHTVPVLVDFWAEWCGPCKVLGPILERLAGAGGDSWVLAKVDTDAHQDLAATYEIRSIPTVKLFADGKVIDEFVGALPESAIRHWLTKAVPGRHRKELVTAEALLEHGKEPETRAIAERILVREPGNEHALVLLAKTLLFDDPKRVLTLLDPIEEHSDQYPSADSLKTIGRLLSTPDSSPNPDAAPAAAIYREAIRFLKEKNFREALQRFIEVIRIDREYDDDGARKACIGIFRFLGDEHVVTKEFRRAFSSALY